MPVCGGILALANLKDNFWLAACCTESYARVRVSAFLLSLNIAVVSRQTLKCKDHQMVTASEKGWLKKHGPKYSHNSLHTSTMMTMEVQMTSWLARKMLDGHETLVSGDAESAG